MVFEVSFILKLLIQLIFRMPSENSFDVRGMIFEGLSPEQISILKRFAEKIQQYFEKSYVSVPKKIYHYTTLPIAKSIYQTRKIWLFSVFDPASKENQGAGTVDQQEVIAGLNIICDEVNFLFKKQQMHCFHIFAEKFETTFKKYYREFATVHIFCVTAAPNSHLWNEAAKRDKPACLELTDELFVELCHRNEEHDDISSSGQYFPCIVCYDAEDLRQRIRPFCISAIETLKEAVDASNSNGEFLWSIMQELSKQLALPFIKEAFGYKSPKFAVENEVRLLKIFPYGFCPLGQTEHSGRLRVIESIEPNLPIKLLSVPPQ